MNFRYVISGSLALVSIASHLPRPSLDFSSTLTTEAFDLSRLRRFEANSYQPTPMDLTSSPVEHGHSTSSAAMLDFIAKWCSNYVILGERVCSN
jgi:hypothetical protein